MTSGSTRTKLAEQEFSKEAVVPVPLAPAIERDEERIRSLESAQLPLCAWLSEHGLTQRRAQLIEHRCATEEPLIALGQLAQRLAIQVVRDVAVVPRDRLCRPLLSLATRAARYRPTGQPSVRSVTADACSLVSATCSLREDLFGSGRVESKVAHAEVERITRRSQSRDVRLFATARCDQLGAARNSRDHHAEHVVAGRRLKLVQVVQHHHEWCWARLERGRETWRGATQQGHAESAHISNQSAVAGERCERTPRPVRRTGWRDHRRSGRATPKRRDDPQRRPTGPAASTCRIRPVP